MQCRIIEVMEQLKTTPGAENKKNEEASEVTTGTDELTCTTSSAGMHENSNIPNPVVGGGGSSSYCFIDILSRCEYVGYGHIRRGNPLDGERPSRFNGPRQILSAYGS